MDLYRERFSDQGLFENAVYPGISDVLVAMQAEGSALYKATSNHHVNASLDPYQTLRAMGAGSV